MSNTKESVVLKYDDMGIPSIMLKIENTAKTPEEADRMFFVRGVEYDAVYLSRFVNWRPERPRVFVAADGSEGIYRHGRRDRGL